MKIRSLRLALMLALAAFSAAGAHGQTLEISHRDGKALLLGSGAPVKFERDAEIRIVPGRKTGIRITGTNSAVYACNVDQKPVDVPEMVALREFLGKAGTLIPVGLTSLLDRMADSAAAVVPTRAEQELIQVVERADAAIHGPHGFHQVYLNTLAALNRMRDPAVPVETAAGEFRRKLGCPDGVPCTRLAFVDTIVEILPKLMEKRRALTVALAPSGAVPVTPAADAADSILSNARTILDAAHEVQGLALTVAHAKSSIDCDPVQVSRDTGRKLTIAVEPRPVPELKRAAAAPPMNFAVTVMPRLRPYPSVGLALLYAPRARYETYGTAAAPGGARIVTTGFDDDRVGYGLVLGLAWNDRVGPTAPRARLWLPEIIINPTDELKTLGVGGGVSLGIVKLGVGAVWNRHTRLVDQRVDQVLESADLLRKEDGYGRPRAYVSLSAMGWPPFLKGK
jgi:hypothetical protein